MFSLKKWNAVAMWSWDVECDTCAICRVQVMGQMYACKKLDKKRGKDGSTGEKNLGDGEQPVSSKPGLHVWHKDPPVSGHDSERRRSEVPHLPRQALRWSTSFTTPLTSLLGSCTCMPWIWCIGT